MPCPGARTYRQAECEATWRIAYNRPLPAATFALSARAMLTPGPPRQRPPHGSHETEHRRAGLGPVCDANVAEQGEAHGAARPPAAYYELASSSLRARWRKPARGSWSRPQRAHAV
eukprot:9876065-Alexandrium_andersonii.AAC.1